MKTKLILSLIALTIMFKANAQKDAKMAEIEIKTTVVCEMCEKNIKNYLVLEKGVKKVNVDLKTKIVKVKYNPEKTSPEKIRKAITNAGYDADDVPANKEAFDKLDDCCKKGKGTCTEQK